jgi:tetratricopeptide (TPR) repeat protein
MRLFNQRQTTGGKFAALILFAVFACTFFFGRPLQSQSLFQNSGGTARTAGLGGPQLLGPVDASAAVWNPAALAGLREAEFILASNRSFEFSFAGVAGYWPAYGSFGLSLARFPMAGTNLERMSAGWAYAFGNAFSLGLSLHGNRFGQDEFATATAGAVWHPFGERLPLSRDPHPNFFNTPLTTYPLAFSIQASDVPLGHERLSPYYVAGVAARLDKTGPAVLCSFSWRDRESLGRLGVALPVIQSVAVYGGFADFKPKNTALGLTALGLGYSFDVVYSFADKKILSGVAFRLGAKPGDRARRHLSHGKALIRAANFRRALKEFEYYFKYEGEDLNARQIAAVLTNRIREDDEKIAKLLVEAAAQEKRFKYVEAAVNYLSVLQINRDHRAAAENLARLQPRLDFYIYREYNKGRQLFDEGNYLQARKAFENILLLRKNYAGARDYLDRLDELQQKAAQEAYLTGLGYFSQQNFAKALEFFQQALSLSPNYEEAQDYLDKAQAALQQQKEKIGRLLAEAERLSRRQQINNAYRAYREVLDLEPENETARQQIRSLQNRIDAFVGEKLQAANRAYDRGDYGQAAEFCQQILAVSRRHEEATALLQRIGQFNTRRAEEFVRRGLDYFEARDWNRAVGEFDKALGFDPKNKMAQQKREEALSQSGIQQLLEQAQVYFSQSQFLQAIEFYRRILERDPVHAVARARLEECQRQLNSQVEKYFERGLRLYAVDDYEGAIREWDKVLNIDPTHKQSLDYKQRARQQLETLRKLQE